jgi:hypothetical protein
MKILIRLLGVVVILVLVGATIGGLTVVSMGENPPTGEPPTHSLLAKDQFQAAEQR